MKRDLPERNFESQTPKIKKKIEQAWKFSPKIIIINSLFTYNILLQMTENVNL